MTKISDKERQARIRALRARRAARGDADPLTRLRAHVARCTAEGAPVITERR